MNRDREDWRLRALCAQADSEAWFPTASTPPSVSAAAKRICSLCTSRAACLEEALSTHDQWGIRAGLTPKERRPLLRARAS